ncbi:IS5 family transposase [Streptomyces sp. NPDC059209]|uniref:IS5 family transposase n=1 Tax=Streptomyces sp. NPDC059209 TaxID=3346769 RepID=UPI0036A0A1BA
MVGPGVLLTDAQWARIEPLLPDRTPRRGARWRDHREVIDAIAWRFQTGSQWLHLPEKYGNWQGGCNRLRMWAVGGTWERVFTALMAQADADEDLNRAVSVDSTIVRAHQHAAGARKKGPRPASRTIRKHLRKRGIRAVIPIPADQRGHRLRRGSQGGRPPAFDRNAYKQRNTVERCINKLKQWRGIATHYDKTAAIYLAGLHLAGIFIWSAR